MPATPSGSPRRLPTAAIDVVAPTCARMLAPEGGAARVGIGCLTRFGVTELRVEVFDLLAVADAVRRHLEAKGGQADAAV